MHLSQWRLHGTWHGAVQGERLGATEPAVPRVCGILWVVLCRVSDLARLSLQSPEYVAVHAEAEAATPQKLKQMYVPCTLQSKLDLLWFFLKTHQQKRTIVFLATCKQVHFLPSACFSRHLQAGAFAPLRLCPLLPASRCIFSPPIVFLATGKQVCAGLSRSTDCCLLYTSPSPRD